MKKTLNNNTKLIYLKILKRLFEKKLLINEKFDFDDFILKNHNRLLSIIKKDKKKSYSILINEIYQSFEIVKNKKELLIKKKKALLIKKRKLDDKILKKFSLKQKKNDLKIKKKKILKRKVRLKLRRKKKFPKKTYLMFLNPKKNNFFVSVFSPKNKLIFSKNTGSVGFEGPKRTTIFAYEALGKEVSNFLVKTKIRRITIFITSRINRALRTIIKQFRKIWKNTYNKKVIKFDYIKGLKYCHGHQPRKKKARRV